MTTESSPYLTVGALRDLLAGWPDDRPVLVGTVAGTVARVVYSCHETAEGTDTAGEFRTRARPPAEYMSMPPPQPGPEGEVGGARVDLAAAHMSQLLPAMRALLDSGWVLSEMTKPLVEGCGDLVGATFVRDEMSGDEARIARMPGLAEKLDDISARPDSEFRER